VKLVARPRDRPDLQAETIAHYPTLEFPHFVVVAHLADELLEQSRHQA
jgi:hypothetical protein